MTHSYFTSDPKVNHIWSTFKIDPDLTTSREFPFYHPAILFPLGCLPGFPDPPSLPPLYSRHLLNSESKYPPPSPLLTFPLPPSSLSDLLSSPWPPWCFQNVWHVSTFQPLYCLFHLLEVISCKLMSSLPSHPFLVIIFNETCYDHSILSCHPPIPPALLITFTLFYFIKYCITYICFRTIVYCLFPPWEYVKRWPFFNFVHWCMPGGQNSKLSTNMWIVQMNKWNQPPSPTPFLIKQFWSILEGEVFREYVLDKLDENQSLVK